MAEVWVTTRTYRKPCHCYEWRGPQQQEHKPGCSSLTNKDSVVTLGLKLAANDRLWQIWVACG